MIDNEAGLENLSRRIIQKVDLMVIVADPSRRGIETMGRLHALAGEMGVQFGEAGDGREPAPPRRVAGGRGRPAARIKADHLAGLPDDAELSGRNEAGVSLGDLSPENEVVRRIDRLLADAGV